MALKGEVNAQGQTIITFDAGDKVIMSGVSMTIPRNLPSTISPANLTQLVTAINQILTNQRTFATILGITTSES